MNNQASKTNSYHWLVPIVFLFSIFFSPSSWASFGGALSKDVTASLPLYDGRVIAGTTGGLVLLDKELNPVSSLTSKQGLPKTAVHVLSSIDDKSLWAGTDGGLALVKIDGDNLSVVRKINTKPVRDLLKDSNGMLVATWDGGVLRLNKNKKSVRPLPFRGNRSFEQKKVTALCKKGTSIYASTAGAGIYQLTNNSFVPVNLELPSKVVFSLHQYDNRLWAGTLAGLVVIENNQVISVSNTDVRTMLTVQGKLWAGTFGQGVLRIHRSVSKGNLEQVDSSDFINSLSKSGNTVYVSTTKDLIVIKGNSSKKASLMGPPSANISAMVMDADKLWVGTFDQGLGYLDKNKKWTAFNHRLLDRRINALALEGSRLWVGTARGLVMIDQDNVRRFTKIDGLPHDDIHSIVSLKKGKPGVLVGTGKFAAIVNRHQVVEVIGQKSGMPNRGVWAVEVDNNGTWWMGTTAGLFSKPPSAKYVKKYSVASGHLRDGWITSLTADGDTIWVGTYSKGVSKLVRQENKMEATHLGGGYINPDGIFVNNNTLWAATMEGLKKTDLSTQEPVWKIVSQAAPGSDVTAIVPLGQILLIGSRSGIGQLRRSTN